MRIWVIAFVFKKEKSNPFELEHERCRNAPGQRKAIGINQPYQFQVLQESPQSYMTNVRGIQSHFPKSPVVKNKEIKPSKRDAYGKIRI